jgi:type III secretory pathway lipoprotein EscJ
MKENEVHWKKVYSTTSEIEAEMVRGFLEEEGLEVVIMNKQDSAFSMIGQIEVYVPENDFLKAVNLINSRPA